ncbi:hypothetical protein WDU94_010492 [Cyamophila willieti]
MLWQCTQHAGSIATLDRQGNPLEKEILGGSIANLPIEDSRDPAVCGAMRPGRVGPGMDSSSQTLGEGQYEMSSKTSPPANPDQPKSEQPDIPHQYVCFSITLKVYQFFGFFAETPPTSLPRKILYIIPWASYICFAISMLINYTLIMTRYIRDPQMNIKGNEIFQRAFEVFLAPLFIMDMRTFIKSCYPLVVEMRETFHRDATIMRRIANQERAVVIFSFVLMAANMLVSYYRKLFFGLPPEEVELVSYYYHKSKPERQLPFIMWFPFDDTAAPMYYVAAGINGYLMILTLILGGQPLPIPYSDKRMKVKPLLVPKTVLASSKILAPGGQPLPIPYSDKRMKVKPLLVPKTVLASSKILAPGGQPLPIPYWDKRMKVKPLLVPKTVLASSKILAPGGQPLPIPYSDKRMKVKPLLVPKTVLASSKILAPGGQPLPIPYSDKRMKVKPLLVPKTVLASSKILAPGGQPLPIPYSDKRMKVKPLLVPKTVLASSKILAPGGQPLPIPYWDKRMKGMLLIKMAGYNVVLTVSLYQLTFITSLDVAAFQLIIQFLCIYSFSFLLTQASEIMEEGNRALRWAAYSNPWYKYLSFKPQTNRHTTAEYGTNGKPAQAWTTYTARAQTSAHGIQPGGKKNSLLL